MPSPSSSVYAFKPSGSLKFKGGEGLPSADKKKKKKTKSSSSQDVRHAAGRTPEGAVMHKHDKHREGAEGDEERSPVEAMDRGRPMTAAERKFEEVRRKRMQNRVAKEAKLSHKDRVDQFNESLAKRSEHNDMLTVSGH